jgi:hypothetical protein
MKIRAAAYLFIQDAKQFLSFEIYIYVSTIEYFTFQEKKKDHSTM